MQTTECLPEQPETFLRLSDAARLIPSLRGGKPTHPATLTRWILRGVGLQSGETLKLAARRFPGGWAVSKQALDAFIDRLTADRCGSPAPGSPSTSPSRNNALAAVDRQLDAAGF